MHEPRQADLDCNVATFLGCHRPPCAGATTRAGYAVLHNNFALKGLCQTGSVPLDLVQRLPVVPKIEEPPPQIGFGNCGIERFLVFLAPDRDAFQAKNIAQHPAA
jgi:hypothetical protein